MLFVVATALAGQAERVALERVAGEPGVSWQVERVVPWAGGTHVHLRPVVGGLPVELTRVITLGVRDELRRDKAPATLDVAGFDPSPALDEALAIELASQWVADLFGQPLAWEPRAELVARPERRDSGKLRPVWVVHTAVRQPFAAWDVLVDAKSGEVVGHRRASFDARAQVYPSNPDASALTEVELLGLTSETTLSGEYAYAWSCDQFGGVGTCSAKSSHAAPDADGNYLFAPDATSTVDPMAEVQMYYHLDLVSRWFESEFGLRLPEPIEGLVNFDYDNAFFGDADGDGVEEVAFGQNTAIDFAYDADVIYHEFGHAVIGQVTSLGLFGADAYGLDFSPLSLNEGSADVFSIMITGDPLLGEYAGGGFGLPVIRDLGPDRRCPYDLYGEGHEDGMIWGAVAWNMAEDPLLGTHIAAQLFYGAAQSWSTESVSWSQAGDSLVAAADDLLAAAEIDASAHAAILSHVEAGGLPGCERIIPLDEGNASTQFFIATGLAEAVGGYVPLSTQMSLHAPEGTKRVRLRVDSFLGTVPDVPWTVFVRRGAFVEHSVDNVLGLDVPIPSVYDFAVDGVGADNIVLDADSDPPLQPGETYYFAISTRSEGLSSFDFAFGEATFSGEVVMEDPADEPPVDPGGEGDGTETPAAGDEEEGKGGCGCATGTSAGWPILLAALAFARGLGWRRCRA
jgi:Zn-dependent metalloprotease